MESYQKKSGYNQHKNEYTQNYIRNNYRQLSIRIPINGEITREGIATAAENANTSINAYILQAVRERMEREGGVKHGND